ncbi:MAG: hypothetical protein JXR52_02305 [Bacteroidales bacterium]|nr:hypothetical protein [Bacteroidales bacterium]
MISKPAAGKKNRFLRWTGRLVLMLLVFIAIAAALFYLKRDAIKDKAVRYVNDLQPGEVHVGRIKLIPFLNFPLVSVGINDLKYFEKTVGQDTGIHEPILILDELSLSFNIMDLLRGDININKAGLSDGELNIIQYDDSTTNIENAVGSRFMKKKETPEIDRDSMQMTINLDHLRISNLEINYVDNITRNHAKMELREVSNRFSYFRDFIKTGLKLDLDLTDLQFGELNLKKERNVQFESEILYDREKHEVIINPSIVGISGTLLEVWGAYLPVDSGKREEPSVDLTFRAVNTGLELLNFLFRGVLNLEELEQIGSGTIYLSGSVKGNLGQTKPVVRVNCKADGLGLNIKSLHKSVRDISFSAFATNGKREDLSDAMLIVKDFNVKFPEGYMKGDLSIENRVTPGIFLNVDADVNLSGLDRMINSPLMRDLNGTMRLNGTVSGSIDRQTGDFLKGADSLVLSLDSVRFLLPEDTVENLNGKVYLDENLLGVKDMEIELNENVLRMDAVLSNLLPFLYGMKKDLAGSFSLSSEILYPERLFNDTNLLKFLGKEIRGLKLEAGAAIEHGELERYLSSGIIPGATVKIDNFQTALSSYADISDVAAELIISPDTIDLQKFSGKIGNSRFTLNTKVSGYDGLIRKDSTATLNFDYMIESELMRAEDFFTVNNEFLIPETYRSEYLEDLILKGKIFASVQELLHADSVLDFRVMIENLEWKFRKYPLAFKDFYILANRRENELIIEDFRGRVGESNLEMKGIVNAITDSTGTNVSGKLMVYSDLLDFNELLNYQVRDDLMVSDSSVRMNAVEAPPELHEIDYPDLEFGVDIKELRYDSYRIFGMEGNLRSSGHKIIYLDSLNVLTESGGRLYFNGQFSVANPDLYTFSADLELDDVNIKDLNIELHSGDEQFTLEKNFEGIVDAKGMAEIFLTPELRLEMPLTTAIFNVNIRDGALINFTPLEVTGKFIGNKDLSYVRFAELYNRFTLLDSRINIPLMSIGSTIGQILIEGEQGLDNSYVYLLRIPVWLVKGAARNMLSEASGSEEEEEQIYDMKSGKFMKITAWGNASESYVKFGDKRDRIR